MVHDRFRSVGGPHPTRLRRPTFPLGKALFLLFLVTLPDEVAVHEQDVEDIPVMPVVDQAAVVQDGAVGAVLLDQAEGDIVVGAVLLGVLLGPDTLLHGLALVRVDEVAEAVVGEGQEILQVGAAGEADHLLVGEEQLVVDPVGLVDEEGAGEMLEMSCKAKPRWVRTRS